MNQTWKIGKYLFPVTLTFTEHSKCYTIRSRYHPTLLQELRSFQGAKWEGKEKVWKISKSPRNQYQIQQLTDPQPYPTYPIPQYDRTGLRPQQIIGVEHILRHHRCGIAFDMGMGKTLIAYRAIEALDPVNTLIICPANIRLVWMQEYDKWKPNIPLPEILSYSQLKKYAPAHPPHAVVIDESIYIKNPASQRSQITYHITKSQRDYFRDPITILLSGVPAPKDQSDWWHQTEVIHPGYLRESSNVKLRQRLADIEWTDGYPKIVGWKDKELVALGRRLNPMWIKAKQTNSKHYHVIEVTPERKLVQAAKIILKNDDTHMAKRTHLSQISDGFIYTENNTPEYIPNRKLAAFRSLLNQHTAAEHNRLLVFAQFTASIDLLTNTALEEDWNVITLDGRGWRWFGIDRLNPTENKANILYKRFQSTLDHPICLISHPQSGGSGLTLPAPSIIFYSNDYNGSNRLQAEARTRNPGVNIYDIIHLPCDSAVLNVLKDGQRMHSITIQEIANALN